MLSVLNGKVHIPPPVWLMRQAGRYLPEYRDIRSRAGTFLDLCYNPDLATEVTLQPIRRYQLDAAILFSDILVVPDALGQQVWFETGEGPRLAPISAAGNLPSYDRDHFLNHLDPCLQALTRLRNDLPDNVNLIGFCGAPWTVASYMVGGRSTPDLAPIRALATSHPDQLQTIIDLLIEASIDYLIHQIDAGAQILQIFESWAGVLQDTQFDRWSLEPISRIVSAIHKKYADIPIIVFPRNAGDGYLKIADLTGVSAVSVDHDADLKWIRNNLQTRTVVQGNLHPGALAEGPEAIDSQLKQIHRFLGKAPWIANIGHGIRPTTPPEHVGYFVDALRRLNPND